MPLPIPPRLSLATDLRSRAGSLSKDALITNGFVETKAGKKRVYFRPGLDDPPFPDWNVYGANGQALITGKDGSGNSVMYTVTHGTIGAKKSLTGFTLVLIDNTTEFDFIGAPFNFGSCTPGTYLGQTIFAVQCIVSPSAQLLFNIAANVAQNFFTQLVVNGTSVLSASASTFSTGSGNSAWSWVGVSPVSGAGSYTMQIG